MNVNETPAASQTRYPWRATLRTVVAFLAGAAVLLPVIVQELGLQGAGWVGACLGVAAAVTRILAIPAVDDWLRDHGLLSAEPRSLPPAR